MRLNFEWSRHWGWGYLWESTSCGQTVFYGRTKESITYPRRTETAYALGFLRVAVTKEEAVR